ncbi:uncharacterized protein LOC133504604 isoform X2 [Syngnathoides biaculeatus]|uniref:uncharacterized protein LOC133504604 isoform X2 n=1 Tax=Syngnathoides biaculeatus TaxID=300417 RepID=UPI002ADE846E|nr:uncharacterized protein LOC133504604 isoform X2 [Syngnathoides biaculeatus]
MLTHDALMPILNGASRIPAVQKQRTKLQPAAKTPYLWLAACRQDGLAKVVSLIMGGCRGQRLQDGRKRHTGDNAQSPDFKPIEHLWKDLEMAAYRCSPSNLTELERICKSRKSRFDISLCTFCPKSAEIGASSPATPLKITATTGKGSEESQNLYPSVGSVQSSSWRGDVKTVLKSPQIEPLKAESGVIPGSLTNRVRMRIATMNGQLTATPSPQIGVYIFFMTSLYCFKH